VAAQIVVRAAHGLNQVALVVMGDQVRHDLGVRLRRELRAGIDQLLAQLGVVLDDPVQDDVDTVLGVEVRMCVVLRDASMRRPARVRDARGRVEFVRAIAVRALRDGVAQLGEVADGAHGVDPPVDEQGETRRVVAAVLEHLEPVHEQFTTRPVADVSDDSAHKAE
jgi:hypothetical protein